MIRSSLVVAALLVACSKPQPREDAPASASAAVVAAPPKKREKAVFDEIGVPSSPSELNVRFVIPKGTSVNDDAPFRIRWKSSEALENAPEDVAAKGQGHDDGFLIALRPAKDAKVARLVGDLELVVCDSESHSICIPVKREVDLTFVVGGGAPPRPVELQLPSASG